MRRRRAPAGRRVQWATPGPPALTWAPTCNREAVCLHGLPVCISGRRGCPTKCEKSAWTVSSFQRGDSVYTEHDGLAEEQRNEHDALAAVAADDAQPKEADRTRRNTRETRDITPNQQGLKPKWAGRNDATHVGNIGWWFANWGKPPNTKICGTIWIQS